MSETSTRTPASTWNAPHASHAAPHSADVPLPAAESRTFLDKLLVDAGHTAQLGAHAIGEDAAEIYGTAWDFAEEHVLPQQRKDGSVPRPKPSRLRNVFSSGVGRLAEMGSLALADAATFGLASQGPLREQFEQIADTNLNNGVPIDLDAVTGTAKDIAHVFDPFEQFRLAVRDAGRAADREDDKELGERMVDAIAAALAAIELGRGLVETRPPRRVPVEPPVPPERPEPPVPPERVNPEAHVERPQPPGGKAPHADRAVTPQGVDAEGSGGSGSRDLEASAAEREIKGADGGFVDPIHRRDGLVVGTPLSESELDALRKDLRAKGITLLTDPGALPEGYAGGFSADGRYVALTPDATLYDAAHESLHVQQYLEVGAVEYAQLTELQKEEYVFRGLVDSDLWDQLTDAERDHAIRYVDDVRRRFGVF